MMKTTQPINPARAGSQRARHKRLIIGVIGLALVVTGCTMVRAGYAYLDTLAYRWITGYVDLDDAQATRAKAGLASLLTWHRQTQLPDYAQWLAKVRADAMEPTTAEHACKLTDEIDVRIKRLAERAMPDVVAVALTLSDEQLAQMQKKFERDNEKYRSDHAKVSGSAREKQLIERAVTNAERFYDTVEDAQREVMQTMAKHSPFDAMQSLNERVVRQKEMIKLLRDARDAAKAGSGDAVAAQLQASLTTWLAQMRESPRAAHREYQKRLTRFNCETTANIHNAASPAARARMRDNLHGYENDARALVAGRS